MADMIFAPEDGIDEKNALAIYEGDAAFYRLVLETFLKEITKTKEAMIKTFASEDIENYRILVHGLKGSGGSAGAAGLVRLATESNALIKNGEWEKAKTYHEPVLAELDRLISLIPERLNKKGGENR